MGAQADNFEAQGSFFFLGHVLACRESLRSLSSHLRWSCPHVDSSAQVCVCGWFAWCSTGGSNSSRRQATATCRENSGIRSHISAARKSCQTSVVCWTRLLLG